MSATVVFDVNDFINSVDAVKKFWLSSKLNKLRIETHEKTQKIDFVSINRMTNLEVVVSVNAFVKGELTLYLKTVWAFYEGATIIQECNVRKNNPLRVKLTNGSDKKHYALEVMLRNWDFVASESQIS